jgi:hypothetical protein
MNSCRKLKKKGGCSPPEVPKKATLRQLVELYKKNYRYCLNRRLDGFATIQFDKALELASTGIETNGTRNEHFFHGISASAKQNGFEKLRIKANRLRLKRCRSFDNLFREVDRIIYSVKGLDGIFIYDVALRLGANRGFWPERVYLQRGAKNGAKNFGMRVDTRTIECSSLPSELHCLTAYEMEDFLCIFEACLSNRK